MIFRLFLLFLIFFAPASAWAVCTAGDIYTGNVSVPSGGSIINITLNGDPYTVVNASQVGVDPVTNEDIYSGSWSCTAPPPVTCPDGSTAPNGDLAQCPPQDNFLVCADGTAAPGGDIFACPSGTSPGTLSAQQLLEKQANAIDTSNAFLNAILGAVTDLKNTALQALSAITDASYNIQQAINAQTASLSAAITAGNAAVVSSLTSLAGSVSSGFTALSLKADHAIAELVNIQTTLTGIADNFTLQLANIRDNLVSEISQVRSAVSSGAAMVKAAVDESALNIVNAINAAHQEALNAATDFYADSLTSAQDMIYATGLVASAVGQLPDRIANAILTSEAFAGIQSIPGSLSQVGSNIVTAINGMGNDLLATLDGGLDALNTSITDAIASIDNLTTKAADFFAGTETPYSLQGAAELANPSANPLTTPENVDVSGMLDTNISAGGSCPAPATAEVLGQSLTFSYDPICDWANIVGKLILIIAAFVSIRIMAGAH